MKKHIKILVLAVVAIILLCDITIFTKANTQTLTIGNASIVAGNIEKIPVTMDNFDGFLGGFNFEIKFPEIVKITNVFLGDDKLTSLANGGGDYNISSDNILVISGTCNYGDDTHLDDNSVYYVEFTVTDTAASGEYPVVITDETCVVADSHDTSRISLNRENGKICVSDSIVIEGDINEDGRANNTDLMIFKKYLLQVDCGESFNQDIANMNGDKVINICDLVALGEYFGKNTVYLSDNGDDSNTGYSENAAVATLNRAIEQVCDGGTVYITDTYTIDDTFYWNKHFKEVKISGGILDATAVSAFKISDNVSFIKITLHFKSGADIYANGFELQINDDVVVNGKPNLYGGGTTEVKATSIKVCAGSYQEIYGGGKGAKVIGDTNVVIAGNVNSDLDETDHNGNVYIFGGGNNSIVGGNTKLTIGGNAKSTYIYGAGNGEASQVKKTEVIINGGAFMGAYAGSAKGKCSSTELTLLSGTIEQIFGGCYGASMTGDTRLNILGGTVTRRIYGGCYNDLIGSGFSYSWQSQNHVNGNTTVFLSSNANITLTYKDEDGLSSDRGIFACSRYKSHFDNENSTIIYEDSLANTKFSGLLGQQDSLTKLTSSWPKAAKTTKIHN